MKDTLYASDGKAGAFDPTGSTFNVQFDLFFNLVFRLNSRDHCQWNVYSALASNNFILNKLLFGT